MVKCEDLAKVEDNLRKMEKEGKIYTMIQIYDKEGRKVLRLIGKDYRTTRGE